MLAAMKGGSKRNEVHDGRRSLLQKERSRDFIENNLQTRETHHLHSVVKGRSCRARGKEKGGRGEGMQRERGLDRGGMGEGMQRGRGKERDGTLWDMMIRDEKVGE